MSAVEYYMSVAEYYAHIHFILKTPVSNQVGAVYYNYVISWTSSFVFKKKNKDKSDPLYLDFHALKDSSKYFIHKPGVPDDLDSMPSSINTHLKV